MSRALNALVHSGRAVGLVTTFAGALVIGVVLHANLRAVRRAGAQIGNDVLAAKFDGKVVIGDIDSLSVGKKTTLRAKHVEVTDPDGARAISADVIEATIDLNHLLASLAADRGVVVELSNVHVANADVILDVDADGKPKIAKTFHLRPKPASAPPTSMNIVGEVKEPTMHLSLATIDHAHVHGNLVPPSLDGEADDVHVKVSVDPVFAADNKSATLTARVQLFDGRVTLINPRAPNQTSPVIGVANGELEIAIATKELHGKADLKGSCGGVPVVAHAEIDKDQIEATVDIARTDPAVINAAFTDLPIKQPLEAHVHAHGTLPLVLLDAHAKIGAASDDVTASGQIDLREGRAFKMDVDASKIDAEAFGAPVATEVTGKVHAEGSLGAGAPSGTFLITTNAATVDKQQVPAATIDGHFDDKQVTAAIRASEPGVDASGNVAIDLPTKIVTFDLQARSNSLRSLSRAPNVVSGSGSARAQGTLDLTTKTIAATTSASGDGIATGTFAARHINANGKLSGPIAAPILDVNFSGEEVKLQAKDKSPLVYEHATGHARVAIGPSPSILGAEIQVATGKDGKHEVGVAAQGIHVANGVVEARGLRVTGLGEPLDLDVSVGKGEWNIRAKSDGIDLHRAASVTGIKQLREFPEGTRASVDVDVHQLPDGADGHFDVVVKSEKGFGMGAVTAEAHGKINRGKLTANAKVTADNVGVVEITNASLDVPGRLDARSLERMTGVVELRGTVDLSQGAALFAGPSVERVAGIASFEARIERGDPDALPALRGTVRTDGLELVLTNNGEPGANGPPKSTIAGVDTLTHVAWDGRTEDAELAFISWDQHGLLGSASAKSRLPLVAWATGKEKITAQTLGLLYVEAIAEIPPRDVAELPPFMNAPDLRGLIDARVKISGEVSHPIVAVTAHTNGIRENEKPRGGGGGAALGTVRERAFEPLDSTLEARWDGERAVLTFAVDEREPPKENGPTEAMLVVALPATGGANPQRNERGGGGGRKKKKPPGHMHGLVLLSDVKMDDLLKGTKPSQLPWKASTQIEVQNLALAALPIRPGVTGVLTGRARLSDLNRDPSFEATAHIDNFGTNGVQVQAADVTVGGRDSSLFVHATMDDKKKGQASKATFQLASQSLKIKALDFSWDEKGLTRLDYAVENGRLALLGPLVRKQISEIDGRVDGTGSISIDATSQVFDGGLAVHEGRVYVNSFGEEITDLVATARFDKTGTFKIDDASGKIGQGEFHAQASGTMKGFHFAGADATITATKDGVPISSEAVTFAVATGEVHATAKMSDDGSSLVVTTDIPKADVLLPDRTAQQLVSLDPDKTVQIGIRKKDGELDTTVIRKTRGGTGAGRAGQSAAAVAEAAAAPALATKITVSLGNAVHLEGRGLDVTLAGKTVVEIANELKLTGQIDLRGGTIEVHGRRFTVDHGAVTFPAGGDPSNPTVIAAAYWDAPDRTRVWVEFVGPLRTGKLTLRSEPVYSKNEILSVLLFGRPDPNMATGGGAADQGGDASGATAVGSGFVASDLNQMLGELDDNLDVETDTLSGNRTRALVGHSFFDRRLKVQIGYAPGHTYREPDTTYLFLNWQFIPQWSVVATRGDKGTSILDVLFQHRY